MTAPAQTTSRHSRWQNADRKSAELLVGTAD